MAESMATVRYKDATRVYPGADHAAVNDLNLEIGDGEFMVLVGPSGCGKSTSLRMLAGLEEVNSVRWIGDRDVTNLPLGDRDIAMVFQNYALYPHMTVVENSGFALVHEGRRQGGRQKRVLEAAKLLGSGCSGASPRTCQVASVSGLPWDAPSCATRRCSLADEPLSNLDAKLRVQTRTQIAALQT